jgi:hypothetical protein
VGWVGCLGGLPSLLPPRLKTMDSNLETDIIYFTSDNLRMASTVRERMLYMTAFKASTDLVIGYWQKGVPINEAIENVDYIASMITKSASPIKINDAVNKNKKKKKASSKKKK